MWPVLPSKGTLTSASIVQMPNVKNMLKLCRVYLVSDLANKRNGIFYLRCRSPHLKHSPCLFPDVHQHREAVLHEKESSQRAVHCEQKIVDSAAQ